MPANKLALVRYHALDRCFSNPGKRYSIADLIDECGQSINELTGSSKGVSRRQVYDDIAFMESSQGWSVNIKKIKSGRTVYYSYEDPNYSIKNQALNLLEVEHIQEALHVLKRFTGGPQFEWINEIQVRLNNAIRSDDDKPLVEFEENPFLNGLEYFSPLFNAVNNKQVIEIEYQGFKQEASEHFEFHTWYLKQFNNRWFAFGRKTDNSNITTLALDRINSVGPNSADFIPNTSIDFSEYFDDVIGVTRTPIENDTVVVSVDSELWPYVKSKPIHGSQKIQGYNQFGTLIELDLQINYELKSLLFSYIDQIEILEPKSLREWFKIKSKSIFERYN